MRRGERMSDEQKAKISAANKGKHASPETRAKMSVEHMGHSTSPETRAKLSTAKMRNTNLLGHHHSPETRAKMSASKKGKVGPLSNYWRGGPVMTRRKQKAKRRLLGFNPLNAPFPGCEGHHLDKDHVLYVPKELNRSISHNIWTGRNMQRINTLAVQWYMSQVIR